MSPLVPLGILLVGAGLLFVSLSPRFPYAALTLVVTAGLTWLSVAALYPGLPATQTVAAWTGVTAGAPGLRLHVDHREWLLGLGLATLTLATALTGLARPGGPRIVARGAILLLTFAGLAVVFADDLITHVVAWAGLDFVYFLILILVARGEGVQPQAVLHLTFNSLGTVCLVGAAVAISQEDPALGLSAAAASPAATVWVTLAMVFRLGLFPLHLGLPVEVEVRQGLGVLLRLIPATAALEMVMHLAETAFAEPLRPWLTLFGVAAVLLGAEQLWTSGEPRRGMTFVVIAQSGLALLCGLWAGPLAPAAVAAQALALLLGAGAIYLANGFDEQRPWLMAFSAIGAAAMLGLPPTLGALGVNSLVTGLAAAGDWRLWLALGGIVLAQAVLGAGLLRALLWPAEPLEGGPVGIGAYIAGLAALAVAVVAPGVVVLVAPGLAPAAFLGAARLDAPAGVAWAAAALTLGLGLGLWRFESVTRQWAEGAGALVARGLRLDWLYRLLWQVFRALGIAIANLAQVLEGEGALLWAVALVLALALIFR